MSSKCKCSIFVLVSFQCRRMRGTLWCMCVYVTCMNENDLLTFCFLYRPSTECMFIVRNVLNVYACESWSDFVVTNDLLSPCNAAFSAYTRTKRTIWPDLGFDSYFRFKCCGWMLRMCVYVILSVWVKQRIYIYACVFVCIAWGTRWWFVIAFARLRHWMLLEP